MNLAWRWTLLLGVAFAGADIRLRGSVLPPENPPRPLNHIWTSTGFSPEARDSNWSWPLNLTKDEQIGIALIGSLRGGALTHIRVHWLLDFVTASEIPRDLRHLTFDFGALDATLELLRKYDLRPGFELMGNPSGLVGDLLEKHQRRRLRALLLELTQRYATKYGAEETQKWRWETWNEPDLRQYWNASLPSYLAYYHAVFDALRDAQLSVGGPAGLFHERHLRCWAMLEEAVRHTPANLAFISFHRKGNASATQVIDGTREVVASLRERFPTLASIPVANDEADPLSGWWRPCDWRSDVRYAAMVARSAVHLLDDVEFLSNDNAFLPRPPHFFSQRTLLARFPDANHSHFFIKPVAVTLALMSLLGNERLPLAFNANDARLSALAGATKRSNGAVEGATLITFSDDTRQDNAERLTLDLKVFCQNCSNARYALFIQDNVRTNPARVWSDAGSPSVPDAQLRKKMRNAQGPFRAVLSAPLPSLLSLTLRLPSVAVVQVCGQGDAEPGAPRDLHSLATAPGETLLLWNDITVGTKCLIGYEVQSRRNADADWLTLTHGSILTQWHHDDAAFEYRVRAVDLWDRKGPFSNIFQP